MRKAVFQKQLFLIIAALILMFALFIVLIWRPQAAELSDLRQEIAEAERNMEQAKMTLERLEAARQEAPEVDASLAQHERKLPEHPQLPVLLRETQDLANDAGVELLSFRPNEPVMGQEYGEINIAVTVEGTYFQIADFAHRLENADRLLKTVSVSISYKEDDYPDLSANLDVIAFVINPESVPKGVMEASGLKASFE